MNFMTCDGEFDDGLGARIIILERGDRSRPMRFRMILPKGYRVPSAEIHPDQREDFRVLRGTFGLGRIDGKDVVLRAGDTFRTEPGVAHHPANVGPDELELECTLTPGLDSDAMFASLFTSTREHRGLARVARAAMVLRSFRHVIEFPAPARTGMTVLASIAALLGVKVRRVVPAAEEVAL